MAGTRDASTPSEWRGRVLEGVVAFGAMALFVALCPSIHVNAMLRIGQISGLASLQLRFVLIVLPLIVALVVAARVRDGAHFATVSRVACAALAGLASAFVAGGIVVALRATDYCLNAHNGDAGMLGLWANYFGGDPGGQPPPPFYPPLFSHVHAWYMHLVGEPALYALKDLQIALTAVIGPLAYLAWRMLLKPGWALAIGVVAALVVIDPYKPYEGLVLVVLVPLLLRFVQTLRTADDRTVHQLAKAGVLYGVTFGLLCLTYSGWFKWSAPGFVVAAASMVPWRGGRWKASAIVAGVTLVVFVAVIWSYLGDIHSYSKAAQLGGVAGIGGEKPMVQDNYIYFDVVTDPAYFAMWKGDLPGTTAEWPPYGELGGLGVYQLLLFAGFGLAIAFARPRSAVITLACVIAGAWVMRFYYAHLLYETKLVQLYPRTSIELAYCFLAMAGLAVRAFVERVAGVAPTVRGLPAMIGAVCALALAIGTAGSSIADRYMPANARTLGYLAWTAHEAAIAKVPPDPP